MGIVSKFKSLFDFTFSEQELSYLECSRRVLHQYIIPTHRRLADLVEEGQTSRNVDMDAFASKVTSAALDIVRVTVFQNGLHVQAELCSCPKRLKEMLDTFEDMLYRLDGAREALLDWAASDGLHEPLLRQADIQLQVVSALTDTVELELTTKV